MTAVRVCAVGDIEVPGTLRVEIDDVPVAMVRDESGHVHAISDTCSHAEVSLSEGEVEDCSIECWLHGSQFDLRTGRPLALPALTPVPVYPVTIEGDDVYVDVSKTIGDIGAAKEN